MKTIGFVDYYISEWHANNYPVWIKEICEKNGDDFCVKYAWAEQDISPVDGRSTDEWCEEFGVVKCESLAKLCEKSDYILVLSPSNPEKHLEYAKEVLKYKKNTYIDKTFAPDYAEAKEIFDIAEKYGTKFFSSSALRYAEELDSLVGSNNSITFGRGDNIDEYIIHQIEMSQKIIDEKPLKVKVENQGTQFICSVLYENNKKASMIFTPSVPFSVCADTKDGESIFTKIESGYFKNLLEDILNFFDSGKTSFDTVQTLHVMKIREAVIKGKERLGTWIEL